MICDFAIHDPDREEKEPNLHFHVLCPIRPLNPDGSWGEKQHREYVLDENGERIRDGKGKYVFNAVPTTDWGRPETLEAWRKAWCELCNEAFEKKGLAERIDHRSYLRQGIDQIPTEHEGPLVQQMESRGIPTEKAEKNRWIKATNALMRDIAGKIKVILKWMAEVKTILDEKPERGPSDYVSAYQSMRMAGAYSQKAKTQNVKEYAQLISFMTTHKLYTMADMEACSETLDAAMDAHSTTMKECDARKKELKELLNLADAFTQNAQIMTKLGTIHFKGAREKFMQEHQSEIKLYHKAKRKLSTCCDIEKPLPLAEWKQEIALLERKSQKAHEAFRHLRDDTYALWKIKYRVQKVLDAEGKGEPLHIGRDEHDEGR